MSEEQIIRNCAPTLSAIKTGSLFSTDFPSRARMCESLNQLNRSLNPRGLQVRGLRWRDGKALVYLYRPFRRPEARSILVQRGYSRFSPEQALARLSRQLRRSEEFPHEIGLFLGYPPEDVAGFIANNARNCKCCGCWKVYGDEAKAKETFRRFRRCAEEYYRLWSSGYSLSQLTVAL